MKPDKPAVLSTASDRLEAMELPEHAHLPGQNERPPEGFLDPVVDRLPDVTSSENASQSLGWHYALHLMWEGYYWEAHEILEAIWMRTPQNSKEKYLVQGIIHVTNAALKQKMGMGNAAVRLLDMADECFERVFGSVNDNPVMELQYREIVGLIDHVMNPNNGPEEI